MSAHIQHTGKAGAGKAQQCQPATGLFSPEPHAWRAEALLGLHYSRISSEVHACLSHLSFKVSILLNILYPKLHLRLLLRTQPAIPCCPTPPSAPTLGKRLYSLIRQHCPLPFFQVVPASQPST